MKTNTFAALAALTLTAGVRAESPDTDAQAALLLATARRVATVEKDVADLKSRLSALEAQPAQPQPAPAAAPAAQAPQVLAAPAYETVIFDGGATWFTRAAPGTASTAVGYPAPVRDLIHTLSASRARTTCSNGVCTTTYTR